MQILLIFLFTLTPLLNADEFQCPKDVRYLIFLPNPKNCSTYYKCQDGEGTLLECPTGKEFNMDRKSCDMKEEASCWDPIKEAKKQEEERKKLEQEKDSMKTEETEKIEKSVESEVSQQQTPLNTTEEVETTEKSEEIVVLERSTVMPPQKPTEEAKAKEPSTNISEKPPQNSPKDPSAIPKAPDPKHKHNTIGSTNYGGKNIRHGSQNSLLGILVDGVDSTLNSASKGLGNLGQSLFSILG